MILKILKMVDQSGGCNFFQSIHARTDVRNDISNSIRTLTTKFGKHVHQGELTQMRLIKQVVVMLSRQDHITN